ncbi:MAG: DNA polymerase III subunit gamma/tau, partial [Bifidobacteriaceae bacterium]|nr:DNA polymerase III subunit gamma/tau [Bifidobacteriaceae bacterium]
ARILARCLNCERGPTPEPCGQCASCRELGRGGSGSLDVEEIDAASHGGVDDTRDLREKAAYAPARDRHKIFILDEAHMVSREGFNALLKIVEEPPPHVKFIFATTEPNKVLATIRSRSHHYPFRLVPPGLLTDYMNDLAAREGISVDPGVMPLVVRSGGGSVRDTESVLDQLIAGSTDGRVTYQDTAALLGFTPDALIGRMVAALRGGDGAELFAVVESVVESGLEPQRFAEDLLERLRDLILLSAAGAAARPAVRGLPEREVEALEREAAAFGLPALVAAADAVSAGLATMAGAVSPRLQLELLVARALLAGAVSLRAESDGLAAGAPAQVIAGASGGAPSGGGGAVRDGAPTAIVGSGPAGRPPLAAADGRGAVAAGGGGRVAAGGGGQVAAGGGPSRSPRSGGDRGASAAPPAPDPSATAAGSTDTSGGWTIPGVSGGSGVGGTAGGDASARRPAPAPAGATDPPISRPFVDWDEPDQPRGPATPRAPRQAPPAALAGPGGTRAAPPAPAPSGAAPQGPARPRPEASADPPGLTPPAGPGGTRAAPPAPTPSGAAPQGPARPRPEASADPPGRTQPPGPGGTRAAPPAPTPSGAAPQGPARPRPEASADPPGRTPPAGSRASEGQPARRTETASGAAAPGADTAGRTPAAEAIQWEDLLRAVRGLSITAYAMLHQDGRLAVARPDGLVVAFRSADLARAFANRFQGALEEAASRILRRRVPVQVTAGEPTPDAAREAPPTGPPASTAPGAGLGPAGSHVTPPAPADSGLSRQSPSATAAPPTGPPRAGLGPAGSHVTPPAPADSASGAAPAGSGVARQTPAGPAPADLGPAARTDPPARLERDLGLVRSASSGGEEDEDDAASPDDPDAGVRALTGVPLVVEMLGGRILEEIDEE